MQSAKGLQALPPQAPWNVCIVAGEASGDLQGALLVQAWKELARERGLPAPAFWGAAGCHLVEQGVEDVVRTEDLSVMGFADVLAHYGALSGHFRRLRDALNRRRPQVVVLVDYPGFNLRFAEDAKALGAFVCYHIAPKAWAHGEARAGRMARFVDVTSCLLPFEEEWFRSRGVNASFVGNPLFDSTRTFLIKRGGVPLLEHRDAKIIGLLPGSRRMEIRLVLPAMVQGLLALRATNSNVVGVVPVAPTLDIAFVRKVALDVALQEGMSEALFEEAFHFTAGGAYELLSTCGYAWVCSGTATLEAGLLGAPHGVVYRMSPTTFQIAKRLVRLPYVSLVNLAAGELVAPEYLQHLATPSALAGHALRMLNWRGNSACVQQQDAFARLRARFPRDAARGAAMLFLNAIEARQEASETHRVSRFGGAV